MDIINKQRAQRVPNTTLYHKLVVPSQTTVGFNYTSLIIQQPPVGPW